MAETSRLRSSVGCFYSYLGSLGFIHWFVIMSMRIDVDLILFPFHSGFTRYFTVQVALTKGVFPVARLGTGFIAMMLGVLVTLTFGILLAGKLEQN
jgi:hypothetical protein